MCVCMQGCIQNYIYMIFKNYILTDCFCQLLVFQQRLIKPCVREGICVPVYAYARIHACVCVQVCVRVYICVLLSHTYSINQTRRDCW